MVAGEKKMKLTKEELFAAYSAKNKVNKFIRDRVYGMVMVEHAECRENQKLRLRQDDMLDEDMGHMEGDVEILDCDDLEDLDGALNGIGEVRYTYSGYARGDYTDSICFPFECFEAETDKEAYEIYVAKCMERYDRWAKEAAIEKAKAEKDKESRERREYERLKEKYEGKANHEDRTWEKGHVVFEGKILYS